MRKTLATLAILAILSTTGAPASAQQQSTKEQDIRTLIGLTNMDRIAAQMIDLMMPQTREMILALRPDISKKHLDLLLGEMAQMLRQSAPRFIEAMIPLYENRFTQAEIRDIVAFYKTPPVEKRSPSFPA